MNIENQPCEEGVSTLVNNGGGSTIGQNITGTVLNLKTLISGTGISLTNNLNTIAINNTQTPTNTVTNLGSAAPVLVDVLAGSVRARTLLGQGGTLVNQSGNTVAIFTKTPISLGSGEVIYAGDTLTNNQYKSIVPNGNIEIVSDANSIYFKPIITNIINYSGVANMNTRSNGNPEYGSYLGFGRGINVNLDDQFPAEIPALTGEFIGWVALNPGRYTAMKVFMQSLIDVNVTERIDVYASLHRTKGDPNTRNFWQGLIQTYDSNITTGDFVQRTLEINADFDSDWGVYMIIYCQRPDGSGSVEPLSFSVSCGCNIIN